MNNKGNKHARKESKLLRNTHIFSRLTEEELALFNARKGTQNSSEFIRSCVLKGEVKTVIIDQEKAIIKNKLSILRTELGRIGHNINQITKIINSEYKQGHVSAKILAVEAHLLELETTLEKHKKVLSNLSEFS